MSEQIVPVTTKLAAALDRTGLMLRTIEQSGKKLNDADSFKSVANQLEDLTVAVLATTSSLSLIGVTPCGARFNLSPDTDLLRQVTSCVTYLRGPATNLIKADSFSRYESKHVQDVLARTGNLYYLVLGAIRQRAMADLRDVSDRSASVLVALAETIAEAAGDRVDTTPKTPQVTRRLDA